jgi:hypothetical protein
VVARVSEGLSLSGGVEEVERRLAIAELSESLRRRGFGFFFFFDMGGFGSDETTMEILF